MNALTTEDYHLALAEGKNLGKAQADEIAQYVMNQGQEALEQLWPGLYNSNSLVRARTAHVVEAVARQQPQWIMPYQEELLQNLALPNLDPTFNFHFPPLLGLLRWPDKDIAQVVEILEYWLQHRNHQFVKAYCLQSLTDISMQHPWLQHEVIDLLQQHMPKSGKAVNARG